MAQKPHIRLRNINIIYNLGKSNEYHASHDVSFDIYKGEYIIFFGPSGCGKSTLMYCILGALPPASGELTVDDEKPYEYTNEQLVNYQRSKVGIIFQAFYLIPSITVADNVVLPRIFAGDEPKERRTRADKLLTKFGVAAQADKLPLNLSGGQQQRVAVSRSLVGDPDILLADEPVGNLDSISSAEVMGMLNDINAIEGKTVILVTHDAKHLPYAHRVIYFRDGVLQRIVVNPEKEQIVKTETGNIVTEIEQLQRIHPYLSPDELKVKSVVNYLTQDLGIEQLQRLEEAVKWLSEGKVNKEGFYDILVTDMEEGGIELDEMRAKSMADKAVRLVEESRDITRFRRHMIDEKEELSEHEELVQRLRTHLLDEYEDEITMDQLENLENAISKRLLGELKRKEDFVSALRESVDAGGLGFEKKTAKDLSVYLEKLIAQGIRIGGGE